MGQQIGFPFYPTSQTAQVRSFFRLKSKSGVPPDLARNGMREYGNQWSRGDTIREYIRLEDLSPRLGVGPEQFRAPRVALTGKLAELLEQVLKRAERMAETGFCPVQKLAGMSREQDVA